MQLTFLGGTHPQWGTVHDSRFSVLSNRLHQQPPSEETGEIPSTRGLGIPAAL